MIEAVVFGTLALCGLLVAGVVFSAIGLTVGVLAGALKLVGWSLKAVFGALFLVPLVVGIVIVVALAAGAVGLFLACLPLLPFILLGAILLGLRRVQRPANPAASVR